MRALVLLCFLHDWSKAFQQGSASLPSRRPMVLHRAQRRTGAQRLSGRLSGRRRDVVCSSFQDVRDVVVPVVNAGFLAGALLIPLALGGAFQLARRSTPDVLQNLSRQDYEKLWLCVELDLLGDVVDALPFTPLNLAGEVGLDYLALRALFGSDVVAFVGVVEQLFPLTHALPTATLAWAVEALFATSLVAKAAGLGDKEGDDDDR